MCHCGRRLEDLILDCNADLGEDEALAKAIAESEAEEQRRKREEERRNRMVEPTRS
jgi:hypothetical protein